MFLHHADIVIVGASVAGLSAAVVARRQFPAKTITMVLENHMEPPLSGVSFIFGKIGSDEGEGISGTALRENGIQHVVGDVTSFDYDAKLVEIDGRDELSYEKLVIATGTKTIDVSISGSEKQNVFAFGPDFQPDGALFDKLGRVQSVAIIGGGLRGIDLIGECKRRGVKKVTLIEPEPYWIDAELEKLSSEEFRQLGIETKTRCKVEKLSGDQAVKAVTFENGQDVLADFVFVAVGEKPDTEAAGRAGLLLLQNGAIAVDANMNTSHRDVYACGKCAKETTIFGSVESANKSRTASCAEGRQVGESLFTTIDARTPTIQTVA